MAAMKDKTMYMIGNAHLDAVWLWQWQEGFAEVKATFRSVLDRMKEYEDFFFTGSSAAYYEWVEENEPAMFEEIKQRVAQGRWMIVGGWWIQPDCNAPGGESFVRQGLYGQRYFKEKFGVIAHTGYNVDSFGHNGMLPQILKKSGMDQYVFMRPGRHEKGLEQETFRWRSSDGSEVLAFRIPFEYCTWPEGIYEHICRCSQEIREDDGILMCFYGVGNHGGGPTRKNIDSIHELNERTDLPKLVMASPDDYFAQVRKKNMPLSVVGGELLHHASGCYSAHSGVKRWNRKAENRLIMAEKLSVLAGRFVGRSYPYEQYTKGWKEVLFNQFHDIMAGTSIEPAYEDAREAYGEALNLAAKGMNAAVQAISWHIDIPMEEGMKPLVVFNPNAFAGKFEVEMESPSLKEGVVLLDDEDRQVPLQIVQSAAAANGRCRLCFIAELPSLGWRTFRLAMRAKGTEFSEVEGTETSACNEWFSIDFEEKTGFISSLRKNNDGTEYFDGPAAVPTVIEDYSDTWSHAVRIFDKKQGHFTLQSIRCVEKGPVKRVIRVVSTYHTSRLVQDFAVYRELDFISVKTTVDWHEKHAMLKLLFPMKMSYLRASWEIPYGVAQREPDGEEYPMQNFLDVEGANPGFSIMLCGLSFLNDGKSSGSVTKKEVGLTVLRSPIYANHEPYQPDENLEYVYMDQGVSSFTYGLYPHDGCWENAHTYAYSRQLNEKPIALFETYHQGELPMRASLVQVEASNVLLTVIKEAEDKSRDLVLRLVETTGRTCDTKLQIHGCRKDFTLHFTPFEIKTVRLSADDEMTETNLLEEVQEAEC